MAPERHHPPYAGDHKTDPQVHLCRSFWAYGNKCPKILPAKLGWPVQVPEPQFTPSRMVLLALMMLGSSAAAVSQAWGSQLLGDFPSHWRPLWLPPLSLHGSEIIAA